MKNSNPNDPAKMYENGSYGKLNRAWVESNMTTEQVNARAEHRKFLALLKAKKAVA